MSENRKHMKCNNNSNLSGNNSITYCQFKTIYTIIVLAIEFEGIQYFENPNENLKKLFSFQLAS